MDAKIKLEASFLVGPSAPCPCGSGRPAEKCCKHTKPRRYSFSADVDITQLSGAALDLKGGQWRLLDHSGKELPFENGVFKQSYPREGKRDKPLAQSPSAAAFVHPDAFLAECDAFFVIDTNTKVAGGGSQLSISVVIGGLPQHIKDKSYEIATWPVGIFEIRDTADNPEKTAWAILCKGIEASGKWHGKRLVIIVDSCAGDIPDINARKQPLIGDYFLPAGITLAFATADSAGAITNKLIRKCDTQASAVLEALLEAENLPETPCAYAAWCRQFRSWPVEILSRDAWRIQKEQK